MIRGIHYFSAEVKPKLMSSQGAALIKSTIYTCLQKGKIISFEGTKYKFFKYIQTLFLSSSKNNTNDKFLQKWKKYIDVVPDLLN